ncbi:MULTISPECIES: fatty acyl-AMP ligase [Kitasatospora]|uniref:AMP-dependent synthetase/ligase domain-containing protein n=1 Tax=Kitasatospora setae (strain ATCC 33774 / DSM 43861 / JCM 3304 / KCC A-0304 / NBRC 14216 / KM-6054) TaxID=452652 RepID=E4NBI9_KITSK|nr:MULTISPECIES: fatty acyl-AMP ligase [Kitasatospora]BAJ28570.1 hypothetical protein KSE_27590 [Kitasatospora setae KM-6054]
MNGPVTLVEALARHAVERPGREALVVLREDPESRAPRSRPGVRLPGLLVPRGLVQERDEPVRRGGRLAPLLATRTDYAELDAAARRLAVLLADRGVAGGRVLVLQSETANFVSSVLGCLYAGAVAVPAPVPGNRRNHDERTLGILKDAAISLVLTDRAAAPGISRLIAEAGHGGVPCLAVDAIEQPDPADWRMPALDPDAPAVLQYTSGSTGDPRGVMVSHRNLAANQRAVTALLGTGPEDRIGGWLPLHHDMGLIGQLMHPLWLGATSVHLPAELFMRHPVHWLRTVSEHRLTVSGGPDIGYELCRRRVTERQLEGVDLSGWRTAVNAAEDVRPTTLDGFARRFEPYGFRPEAFLPAYGLAEATLAVTGGRRGRTGPLAADAAALEQHRLTGPLPGRPVRELVGCGRPGPEGPELRIVDPQTREELPEGRIGEVWVRGESVAAGYWKRPLENNATFRAVTAAGAEGFLRTGDLGVLRDGELYLTGRLKELLLVAGRNLYPQDIERGAQQLSSRLGAGVVFSAGPRDGLVLVQEVRPGGRADLDLPALNLSLRVFVSREFEVRIGNVLLVRPGTVRRTTSGKLERSTMRSLLLAGRLRPLHQVLDPEVAELVEAASPTARKDRT